MFLLFYLLWAILMPLNWSQDVEVMHCDAGWFGSNCQYKCRCKIGNCSQPHGRCKNGVCKYGWFGPGCQYVDLLYTNYLRQANWINDGSSRTCNPDQSLTVTVNMSSEFPFTWLRLKVNQSSLLQEFQVTFTDKRNERKMLCKNMRRAIVGERTLDIHCDMDDVVQFVILEGDGVKSLCSLYVSGGRNVALRQNTSQSSTYFDAKYSYALSASRNAVDGNLNSSWKDGSCTSTTDKEQNPYWNVMFSSTFLINRYIVYNRKNMEHRIKGFTLRSFTKDLVMVFNYTDMEDIALSVYKITSALNTPPISIVSIHTNINDSDRALSICEVELYGDSACPPSMYGRECQHTCNCAVKNESCFVSTGGCPSGCAAGYQGVDCQQLCSFGKYGDGCNSSCSQFCVVTNKTQSPCFHNNGFCVHGCLSGYQAPKCENLLMVSYDDIILVVVVPLAAVIVLAIVTTCGVILWRRFRTSNKELLAVANDNENLYTTSYEEVEDCQRKVIISYSIRKCNKHNQAVRQITTAQTTRIKKTLLDKQEQNDCLYISLYNDSNSDLTDTNPKGNVYNNTVSVMDSSTSISVRDLTNFVASRDKYFFQQQFYSIPVNSIATTNTGMREKNKHKNQYNNICAYDHSRVLLKKSQSNMLGDYINASYIGGYKEQRKFIASQGPTHFILEDFIRMLLEQDVEIVVMLTNLTENGKTMCERYWPEDDVITVYDIKVKLITTQVFADYTIRRLQLLRDGDCVHELTQFHFTAWPDKDVPTTAWSLVDFEQRLASVSTDKSIVVHCSDGFGRTGTFIALCDVITEAKDTGYINFYAVVQKLRQDRAFMVQTSDQYEFLHRAAMVAVVCMGTTIVSSNITERIEALKHTTESGESRLEQEFKAICDVCDGNISHCDDTDIEQYSSICEIEHTFNNKLKNRFQNVLASEDYRVILMGGSDEGLGDYINAVFIPSFRRKSQQILTQIPLPTTVNDFWRMVTQYKVTLVVAFEVDIMNADSSICNYFPWTENEEISTPYFTLRSQHTSYCDLWINSKLLLTIDTSMETKANAASFSANNEYKLTHITYKGSLTSQTPSDLLALMKEVRSCSSTGGGRVVYMCRNGAEYSGLVCVLSLLLDSLDNDHHVNVPLVVGAVKAVRPQVISTAHQYNLLYQVLQTYNDSNNVYNNLQ